MSKGYYQLDTGKVAAIEANCLFPPLNQALSEPNGLIAIGGDLSITRLINAYSHGIFPWFNAGEPVMWWSPNPRMALKPNQLKISASLKKTLKKQPFEIRFNASFHKVITACSQSIRTKLNITSHESGSKELINQELISQELRSQESYNQDLFIQNEEITTNSNEQHTWISENMIKAYCELHQKGYAICMETWLHNQLVGGCYGVKIGHMFYGESMFHTKTDASKVAFVHLVRYLQSQDVGLIDCQMKTPLLASFGANEISREDFEQQMLKLIN